MPTADHKWTDDAECAGHPFPHWWDGFELVAGRIDRDEAEHRAVQRRAAREVCARCLVQVECLGDADWFDVGSIRAGVIVTGQMVGRVGRRPPTWPEVDPGAYRRAQAADYDEAAS